MYLPKTQSPWNFHLTRLYVFVYRAFTALEKIYTEIPYVSSCCLQQYIVLNFRNCFWNRHRWSVQFIHNVISCVYETYLFENQSGTKWTLTFLLTLQTHVVWMSVLHVYRWPYCYNSNVQWNETSIQRDYKCSTAYDFPMIKEDIGLQYIMYYVLKLFFILTSVMCTIDS